MEKSTNKENEGTMTQKYPRQYLWVSQDFYNVIMGKSEELKSKGFQTGSADLTHRLTPLINQNVKFENLFPKIEWKKKKWKKIPEC